MLISRKWLYFLCLSTRKIKIYSTLRFHHHWNARNTLCLKHWLFNQSIELVIMYYYFHKFSIVFVGNIFFFEYTEERCVRYFHVQYQLMKMILISLEWILITFGSTSSSYWQCESTSNWLIAKIVYYNFVLENCE